MISVKFFFFEDETSSVNQAVKGQTTVTLAGLLAYTNYTIQVAVSNRKGRGPASPRIICLTKEAPPGAPEFVKVKPINATCLVVSWSHPRKPQGLMKSYCLEAIPLFDTTAQDGIVSLFAYNSISSSSSSSSSSTSSYNSISHNNNINNNNDRAKGPCIRPDFTNSYNYYFYCGLIEERPYNISVRGINQFDGHKAWAGPVRPTSNPPIGIISIGGKIIAQNKMSIWMDCLVIGGYQPHWMYPQDDLEDLHIMENGTLVVQSARVAHSGHYQCSTVSDSIAYDLIVQEILEEPPRKPIWHKFTPSLRGIQAEWLSSGSKRLDAPILWFYLNWTNLYTGQMQTIRLSADQRTYYLSNLTCATTVKFQLKAENKVGNSSLTDITSWTTLGSAPLTANTAQLIPNNLRQQYYVIFNLSTFLPGNHCPPNFYHLLIAPSEDGHFGLKQTLINQTITKYDLITIDMLLNKESGYLIVIVVDDAPPLTANTAQLIPNNLRQQYYVIFNLSTFLPGNHCPPNFYHLLIAPSEDGHFGLKQTLINQTITKYDLITIDMLLNKERCCYNVTNLNSGSHYHYKVVATNAAGSASVQGQFWTRTVSGREPVLRQIHLLGKSNFFLQPTIIIPMTALLAILMIVMIALILFCRHQRLEENLTPPNKTVTITHNDLRSNQPNSHSSTNNNNNNLPSTTHMNHVYPIGGGVGDNSNNNRRAYSSNPKRHDHLQASIAPSVAAAVNPQAMKTAPIERHTTGLKSWFNGARIRHYDRGHAIKPSEQSVHVSSAQINHHITAAAGGGNQNDDDERLSTNSVDSEGNINPYATYAATGFGDRTDTVGGGGANATLTGAVLPGAGAGGNSSGGSTVKPSMISASVIDSSMIDPRGIRSIRDLSMNRGNHNVMSMSKPAWNTVFRRGLSIPSNAESLMSTHHYHYPNLDSTIDDGDDSSTLGRPHHHPHHHHQLLRVGSSERLRLAQHLMDSRLLIRPPPSSSSTAALIDPILLGPYNNDGTLLDEEEEEEEEGHDVSENTMDEFVARVGGVRGSMLTPLRNGLIRRINSFESLHQLPRGRSQTYHQGFAAAFIPPNRRIQPSIGAGVNVSRSVINPNTKILPFYESGGMDTSNGGGVGGSGVGVGGGNIQPSDPSVVYRGSVLSSTTVSSNHDELMQAYEYSRKHQLKSCFTLPSNTIIPSSHFLSHNNQVGTRLMLPTHRPLDFDQSHQQHSHRQPPSHQHQHLSTGGTVLMPHATTTGGGVGEGEISGESASSDATDSGIRQFTQQPPQPDETRHATCEIPFAYDVNQLTSRRPMIGSGTMNTTNNTTNNSSLLFNYSHKIKSNDTTHLQQQHQQQQSRFLRCNSDCPSDMTDIYATIDYNNEDDDNHPNSILPQTTTTTVAAAAAAVAAMNRNVGIEKQLYGQKLDRSYQLLPVPPSTMTYCDTDDLSPTAYVPITTATYDDETSEPCQPTSYYYHHHPHHQHQHQHSHPATSHHPQHAAGMIVMPNTTSSGSSGFKHNSSHLSHQLIGSDSSQLKRRVLPMNLSINPNQNQNRDLRKQLTTGGRINNTRQLDKLHTRQLSEIIGEESVGLLSAAGMSGLSNINPIDIYNSTIHGQVVGYPTSTSTNATTTAAATTINTGSIAAGYQGTTLTPTTIATSSSTTTTSTTHHHPIETTEENVYTSEFVLV
ncbi:unnamed protein product [Schistosoma turkestanicum]|nr:unnamed protein product [Schistosoma turkestanicum]